MLAVGLAFLEAVMPPEPDAFGVLVVEHFDGVAVEDPNDCTVILRSTHSRRGNQENEKRNEGALSRHRSQPHEGRWMGKA